VNWGNIPVGGGAPIFAAGLLALEANHKWLARDGP
jgi:hypothetical protein